MSNVGEKDIKIKSEIDMKKPVKSTESETPQATALHRRTEKKARKKAVRLPKKQESISPEETQRTLHELQVHQIELEMQNEEMRRTQAQLNVARARYFDLYDLAPVGYVTVSEQGLVLEANLTATTLLSVSRGKLMNQLLSRFILKEDQDIYYLHRKQLLETGEPQMCELRMVKKDGTVFWTHLAGAATKAEDGTTACRVVMSDITERKREEEALRQSEEKYRNILENIEEGYFEIDLAGNFTFFNDTVCRVLGYPREELIRMNNRHYTDKEEFKKVFQAYNKVYKTGEPNREFGQQITRKDGTKRYIEGSIFLQKDSSGKPIEFRGILRDITERKRAKEQYQEFVEKASDIVFRTDDSGHLTFINPVTLRVTGYSEEEILGKHFLTFIHPDLRDETSKFFGRQFVKGIKNTYSEYPIITKEGHEVWLGQNTQLIAEDGKVTGFQAVSRDITARKRMEEALHQSEEKYRTLLESVQEGYFEIDLAGNYTFFNDSLCRIYNYSKEELMGMNYRQYTDKETRKNGFHEFNKVYNTGEPLKGFTWPIIGKDKTKRYVETSASLLKDLSGKVIGFRGILHDITERKRAEEELKKYREQLEQLVRERTIKLEASNNELEAFSYSISHDLRAPLRAIDGFSHALLEDCEDKLDIQGKDYLMRIRAATQRMSTLIEDLLNLSRITRSGMNMEKVNLTRIVRSVINELQKSQPQRHVKIRIAEGLEDTADSRLIRIALENLLNNAWKFTAKQSETVIEFGSTKEGGKKVYFIRDNGAGFDMTYVDKLFVPFQRLHTIEEYPGTGIGLATVRRIIFRHGGKVRAEGQTDKGATFYFSLHE